jgi:hypothetical protein
MKKLLILAIGLLLLIDSSFSQGCVAIRNLAGMGQFAQLGYGQTSDKWMLDINNRYFEAYNVFAGTKSQGYDSINIYEYTMNLELSHIMKNGWAISVDMPIAANTSVSSLEHASGYRHSTHAFGLGDIRLTVYKWLFDTKAIGSRGNIQVGLGLKFPTGNYHTEDYFYDDPTDPTAKVIAPVNVAIQLGDGGTGITTNINAFYIFNKSVSVYGNFFYLINPKDENGVATWPPNILPPSALALFHQTTNDVNSVPDNYTMRAGANFTISRLVGTAGLRYEGAPAHDLFGQNDGLRRVGHILSLEPGLEYKLKKSILYFLVTVPVDRATVQTVPDKRQEAITGTYTITAGHFANLLFYVGYTFTF